MGVLAGLLLNIVGGGVADFLATKISRQKGNAKQREKEHELTRIIRHPKFYGDKRNSK